MFGPTHVCINFGVLTTLLFNFLIKYNPLVYAFVLIQISSHIHDFDPDTYPLPVFKAPTSTTSLTILHFLFFFFCSWEFTWFCVCLFQSKTMLPLQSTPLTLQSTPLSINKELQWKLPMSQHYCLLGRGKELLFKSFFHRWQLLIESMGK